MSGRKNKKKTIRFLTGVIIFDVIAIIAIALAFVIFIKPDKKDKKKNTGNDTAFETVEDNGLTEYDTSQTAFDNTDITSEVPNTENTDPAQSYADEMLAKMSLHEKVCQMFIITPEAATGYAVVTEAGEKSKQAIMDYPVAGYIYFAQNLPNTEQTKTMLTNVKQYGMEANGIPFFTSVDEEGGDVARCADNLGTTSFNSMYSYREQGEETAYNNAYTIASDISNLGFNIT